MSRPHKNREASASKYSSKVEAEYVFRSVRTGQVMECTNFVPGCPKRMIACLIPRTRDWLFRAEGVSDEEWAAALPKLNVLKRDAIAKGHVIFVDPQRLSEAIPFGEYVGEANPKEALRSKRRTRKASTT